MVVQHPGNATVLDYEDLTSGSKSIYAPADAIYEVYFAGRNVDFNIEIVNSGSGSPNRGDIVYVRIPDTLHANGYVNVPVGESYTLNPYKEKVVLSTKKQPEQ
ncbi:MAG: hypothetical protein HC831_14285, partial [Chloroflexia bacterium]|nr:hypothetical protein [Chloroflexia bacterium]